MILECSNSDGLPNFRFSHDGFWESRHPDVLKVTEGNRIWKCAEDCIKDKHCVAMNYYVSGNLKTYCYHYHKISFINDLGKKDNKESKAYIRCTGISKFINYINAF